MPRCLERLGRRNFHVGDEPWLASAMKLACNMLTAATLQSMGDAFAFLAKVGVPPARAQEILTGSLFDGRVHKAYGQKIVDRRYTPPGMAVPLAMKDLRLLFSPRPSTAMSRCLLPACYTIGSLLLKRAGGLSWTGPPWDYSPLSRPVSHKVDTVNALDHNTTLRRQYGSRMRRISTAMVNPNPMVGSPRRDLAVAS